MGNYAKTMSSELVGCLFLTVCISLDPTFKIKFPEDGTFLKNALEIPHEIQGWL